jgi:hypothetical protein
MINPETMIDPDEITTIQIHCPSHPELNNFALKWCFIPSTGDILTIDGIPFKAEVVEWEHDHGMANVIIYLVETQFPVIPGL